jgi:RNA polymerase sigma factor (sigma-70 family)
MFFFSNKNFGLKESQFEEMICQLKENGNSTWFDTIYLTHLQDCRYIPRQQGIPEEWIEDCEADAILKFKIALGNGKFSLKETHYSLKSYFLPIYRNVCVDWKKDLDKQSKAHKESGIINAATQLPDNEELYRLDEDSIRLVKQAYDQLKPKCQRVLDLGVIEEVSHIEAASKMGMTHGKDPQKAFTTRLKRCRAELKALFWEIYNKENKVIL